MEKTTEQLVADFLAKGGNIIVDAKTAKHRSDITEKKTWEKVANVTFHHSRRF